MDAQGKKPCDHLHKLISGIDNNIGINISMLSSNLLYDEIVLAFIYNDATYIAIYKDTNTPILNITDLTGKSFKNDLITVLCLN